MQVGDTVTLRVGTPAGPTDLVGILLAAGPDTLTVRRRDGRVVTIAVTDVAAGRVVPPGPARRIAAGDLQRVMARGWRAGETTLIGDWLLRAAGGFTGRANSALAVGDPGRPLPDAVAAVTRWYGERGLPARFQLPSRDATPGLADLLDAAGWAASPATVVMTAELGPVLRAAAGPEEPRADSPPAGSTPADAPPAGSGPAGSGPADVRIDDAPDDAWMSAYRQDSPDRSGGVLPPAARAVLTDHDQALFASIRSGGACLAVARVAVDGRWAGLFGVEVDPAQRRRGLATAVSVAALRAAVGRGARLAYLQVFGSNTAGRALWERLGFATHHEYVYRAAPTALS